MSIHINVGYPPAPNGKEWKHLRKTCPELRARAEAGYPIRFDLPNTDHKYGENTRLHERERCPVCFAKSIRAFPTTPHPEWLEQARELERAKAPGTFWVYEVMCRKEHAVQVGKAKDLDTRLESRWKASCRARWGKDCIPWLYDLLEAGRGDEVELVAHACASERKAIDEEKRIRQERGNEGWHEVTGLV